MSKLKLGPVEDDTPVKVAHELAAPVHRDLVEYAKAHAAENGGKATDPVKLISPMLAQFMASDRGFTRGRKTRKG